MIVCSILTVLWSDLDPEDEQRGSPDPRGDAVEAREHYIEVGWVHLFIPVLQELRDFLGLQRFVSILTAP